MKASRRWHGLLSCFAAMVVTLSQADTPSQPSVYVVGYAHLDTQWRWEYPKVISEYLPKTLHDNFALIEKYPDYIFNFTGANRYAFFKEYFPQDFTTLQRYVAAGRWFPGGSNVDEGDLMLPSVESIWRQVLYGNQFFRREFGKAGTDYMDPDAFGYPASLPSVFAHAGLKGFSTQKVGGDWNSAVPVPFNVGVWVGPDGKGIVSALNPGAYGESVTEDLSHNHALLERAQANGNRSGVFTDFRYYGTGDTGGSPNETSVQNVEQSVHGNGPLKIVSATSDQLFRDLSQAQVDKLPRYEGDLLLTEHSAGSLSSQAHIKQWNNDNEILADAAERASVGAAWLGASYPQERLNRAWRLVLGAQMHDILAGTATPKAYEYSWNDQLLALNQFSDTLIGATRHIAAALDTRVQGTPLVVFNQLSIEREDVVEAQVDLHDETSAVEVIGPDGKAVPAQVIDRHGERARIAFVARVPSVGYAVFDVRPIRSSAIRSELKVSTTGLENARYRLGIDMNGDVASLYDKKLKRELLAQPARLALQTHRPKQFPAWNMDWADQSQPPRGFVRGPAQVEVVERGPARVAVRVTRDTEDSHYVQTFRLAAGDASERVEVSNVIDWRTREAALKATFPFTANNAKATYNLGLGTIQRGNNDPKKYEVPAHQWFDLTDSSGRFGVTVLSGAKYGSDKPNDNTLRLTLLYTPGAPMFPDQGTQDWGHHEFVYGLASHAGDWRREHTDWQAQRLNVPLTAFVTEQHAGALGKKFSLLKVDNDRVQITALKKAEDSDDIILRLVELDGRTQNKVRVAFAASIATAHEVDAQERPLSNAKPVTLKQGTLETRFSAYQPRSFALQLMPPKVSNAVSQSIPVNLSYDVRVSSRDGEKIGGGLDGRGNALPAEMLPDDIDYRGVRFKLAGSTVPNAVTAHGQNIALPACDCNRVYVLAAANGDQSARFQLGEHAVDMTIQDWGGYIGQWDKRLWKASTAPTSFPFAGGGPPPQAIAPAPAVKDGFTTMSFGAGPMPGLGPESGEYAGLQPGFIKRSAVAWFASHHHDAAGANVPYGYAYLFAYAFDAAAGTTALTLPNNESIKVLAVTVAHDAPTLQPTLPLYGM